MIVKPVFSIAKATFKEGIRNKIFYNILVFGFLIILSSSVLNKMTVGDETKIIKDLGLIAISIFGFLTILFLGTNHIYHEFEEKIVYTILIKPISRGQYLSGKYVGILFIIAIEIFSMFILMLFLLWTINGVICWILLKALYAIYLELSLLTAIAVMLSTFMRPQLSIFMILAIYIIGHSTSELRMLMIEKGSGLIAKMVEITYYILPNFDNFDIKAQAVHNLQLMPFQLTYATLYGLFYSIIILLISNQIFKRREF